MPQSTYSVLVIGAGLAGLTAARQLEAAGWFPTVLEARERVGGRVYTLRDGFKDGQTAEGGGEFIEEFHHRMIGLAESLGLELIPIPGMESWDSWLAVGGRVGRSDDVDLWGADLAVEIDRLWQAVAGLAVPLADIDRPQAAPGAAETDHTSVEAWLGTLDVHPLAKEVFRSRIRSEYTIEPDEMSLLDLARWAAFYYNEPEAVRKTFRVRGGNDLIPRGIAAALRDVRTGAVVTRIRWDADTVEATYTDANGQSHRIQADRAVIAVPFGPLRNIVFEPGLPEEIRRAVDGLTYGVVTKVMIQYAQRFPEFGWSGRVLTDLPMTCTWPASESLPGTHDIVTVYTGADAGAAFTAMSDEDRIRTAIEQVEQVCPGSAGLVAAARTMAWAKEPFTGGSYAAFKIGEVTAFWEALRRGVGPLVFAGEHIAVHQGYMEGAVESGERAAKILLA